MTMISNPIRFASRYRLYEKFARHMQESGVQLWTAEAAFGDRPFTVTQPDNPRHLQVRSFDELWHKENALNLLAERLPYDWQYIAWIDADIEFTHWRGDHSWVSETVHALQHYMVVQLFQNAIDLGPNGEALQTHHGFVWSYLSGRPRRIGYGLNHWHPGFAWAARREAWDSIGGLIDVGILGAGDNHMGYGFIGEIDTPYSVNQSVNPEYLEHLRLWQSRAERYVRRDLGFIHGTILHNWHGKKKDRRYNDRWKILVDHQFTPRADVKRDYQGLWQLDDHGDLRSIRLRDDIRAYFRSRNEDSIDLE